MGYEKPRLNVSEIQENCHGVRRRELQTFGLHQIEVGSLPEALVFIRKSGWTWISASCERSTIITSRTPWWVVHVSCGEPRRKIQTGEKRRMILKRIPGFTQIAQMTSTPEVQNAEYIFSVPYILFNWVTQGTTRGGCTFSSPGQIRIVGVFFTKLKSIRLTFTVSSCISCDPDHPRLLITIVNPMDKGYYVILMYPLILKLRRIASVFRENHWQVYSYFIRGVKRLFHDKKQSKKRAMGK